MAQSFEYSEPTTRNNENIRSILLHYINKIKWHSARKKRTSQIAWRQPKKRLNLPVRMLLRVSTIQITATDGTRSVSELNQPVRVLRKNCRQFSRAVAKTFEVLSDANSLNLRHIKLKCFSYFFWNSSPKTILNGDQPQKMRKKTKTFNHHKETKFEILTHAIIDCILTLFRSRHG